MHSQACWVWKIIKLKEKDKSRISLEIYFMIKKTGIVEFHWVNIDESILKIFKHYQLKFLEKKLFFKNFPQNICFESKIML